MRFDKLIGDFLLFFIDLMQSFLFLSNTIFLQVEYNRLLFIQCNVFYLFNAIFFINAMQSSFMWLLWLNSEAQVDHLTI